MNPKYKIMPHSDKPIKTDKDKLEAALLRRDIRKPNKGSRIAILWLGWLCIIISPIIGAIPGPGFIIIFPIGLALVLKNSRWAKGLYIRFRRRFPDYGRWTDWALRRNGQKEMPQLPPFKEQIKNLFRR